MPIGDPPRPGTFTDHRPIPDFVDAINPSHYKGFSNGAEVIDIVENLTYNRGAAIKYLARAGKKEIADEVEDLLKAAWYVEREIQRVKGNKK